MGLYSFGDDCMFWSWSLSIEFKLYLCYSIFFQAGSNAWSLSTSFKLYPCYSIFFQAGSNAKLSLFCSEAQLALLSNMVIYDGATEKSR